MDHSAIEKATPFNAINILEYGSHSIVIKSIFRKATGSLSAISFDAGEVLISKISPFDTILQIIEGKAEIIIDDTSNLLETGQSIIVPAHSASTIKAPIRFKMLSTIIKSGYEDFIL